MAWYGARSFGTVESIMQSIQPGIRRADQAARTGGDPRRCSATSWPSRTAGFSATGNTCRSRWPCSFSATCCSARSEGKFSLGVMLAMLALTVIQRALDFTGIRHHRRAPWISFRPTSPPRSTPDSGWCTMPILRSKR